MNTTDDIFLDNQTNNVVRWLIVVDDKIVVFLSIDFVRLTKRISDNVYECDKVLDTKDNVSAHFEDKEHRYRIKFSKTKRKSNVFFLFENFINFTSICCISG